MPMDVPVAIEKDNKSRYDSEIISNTIRFMFFIKIKKTYKTSKKNWGINKIAQHQD